MRVPGLSTLVRTSRSLYERAFGQPRLRFPYQGTPLAEPSYHTLGERAGWAKASLNVAPGQSLRGLIRPPSDASAPWILYYAGNDKTLLHTGQAFLTRLAAEQAWGLGVFAYRGFDTSAPRFRFDELAGDAPSILDAFCAQRAIEPARVHLVAFSLGGYFACSAIASLAEQRKRVASLTLFASIHDIVMYRPSPWQKLSPGDDYRIQPLLERLTGPVLVLQGGADEALRGAAHGQAIARALGERANYLEFDGVGHEALLSHDPALRAARSFISENAK